MRLEVNEMECSERAAVKLERILKILYQVISDELVVPYDDVAYLAEEQSRIEMAILNIIKRNL